MEVYHYKTKSNTAKFSALRFHKGDRRTELVAGWSINKGDYWKAREDSEPKFLSFGKHKYIDGTRQYGLYVGRLALCLLRGRVENEQVS